jgi:NAD(P)-dependent dehydrogenase (short-subunit alcohol dehydrogenase family)
MKGLTGKVAVVTGGSSGIGQAIAIRLGEEGVDVAINYVGRPEGAEETKDAIEHGVAICMKQMAAAGTHPILVAADVSQEDQVEAMYRQVLEQYGRVDILINNAGIQIAEDTEKLAVADFDKVLAVNLRGAFLCAQGALRHFLDSGRGGSIVNVSSQASLVALEGHISYGSSKAALDNITRVSALELGRYNIRVNSVNPTVVMTPMSAWYWGREDIEGPFLTAMPLGRWATEDEIAAPITFLLSDGASMISGVSLPVDGGYSAR